MKNILITSLILFLPLILPAQIFSAKSGEISFYSKAPLENIEAHNTSVNSFISTDTKEMVFIVPVTGFQFQNKLMQEHFNENYMESHKYPSANFNGKINEDVDLTKDGTYNVTSTGKLKIHGVEKEVTEKGTLTVKQGKIQLRSEFSVLVKDYKIQIPKLVFENIAEKIDVKLNITYAPYVKK